VAIVPGDLDHRHDHLDAIPGMGSLEELELPETAAAGGCS